jgi:hemolysin activation/secretion protein
MGFYRLAYVVPVGYWGTRVGASYATFHYQLGKDFTDAVARRRLGEHHLRLPSVHPHARLQPDPAGRLRNKQLNDRVETTQTNVDRIINATKLGVVGDFRDGMLGGGLNSYSFTITEGNARSTRTR